MIIPWQAVLVFYVLASIIAFIAGICICSKSNEFKKKQSEQRNDEEEKVADMEGAKKYFKIVNK